MEKESPKINPEKAGNKQKNVPAPQRPVNPPLLGPGYIKHRLGAYHG
jgi:hypothetical protein